MKRALLLYAGSIVSTTGSFLLISWFMDIPLDPRETAKIAGVMLCFAGLLITRMGIRDGW